jgi:hypothetical protein
MAPTFLQNEFADSYISSHVGGPYSVKNTAVRLRARNVTRGAGNLACSRLSSGGTGPVRPGPIREWTRVST